MSSNQKDQKEVTAQAEIIEPTKKKSRPVIYDLDSPQSMKVIANLSKMGMPTNQIAAAFGMGKTQFYERMRQNPEISRTIKANRSKAYSTLLKTAFNLATKEKNERMIIWLAEKWDYSSETDGDAVDNIRDVNEASGRDNGMPATKQRLLEALHKDPFIDVDKSGEDGDSEG